MPSPLMVTVPFSADAAGLLMHNRRGDPGFVNAFDFDSIRPGVQSLAAAASSRVILYTGSGVQTINLGTDTSPATDLRAQFVVHNELGGGQNKLAINAKPRPSRSSVAVRTIEA